MSRLGVAARVTLWIYGLSPREWAARTWPDGVWRGDVCGCTDDRCRGTHHEPGERCGCLMVLVDEFIAEWEATRTGVVPAQRPGSDPVAPQRLPDEPFAECWRCGADDCFRCGCPSETSP